MEKRFDVFEWFDRCLTCKYGRKHRTYKAICLRSKGCSYEAREVVEDFDEPLNPNMPGVYFCTRCKEFKKVEDMYKRKTRAGTNAYFECKKCRNKRRNELKAAKKEANNEE